MRPRGWRTRQEIILDKHSDLKHNNIQYKFGFENNIITNLLIKIFLCVNEQHENITGSLEYNIKKKNIFGDMYNFNNKDKIFGVIFQTDDISNILMDNYDNYFKLDIEIFHPNYYNIDKDNKYIAKLEKVMHDDNELNNEMIDYNKDKINQKILIEHNKFLPQNNNIIQVLDFFYDSTSKLLHKF